MIQEQANEIISLLTKHEFKTQEIEQVKKVISFSTKFHGDQKRKSGELFVTHPLAVAKILINWGLDIPTICAGILHDVVEDTPASIEMIKTEFGDEVASLVDAVTKVSAFSSQNRADNKYSNDKDANAYLLQVFLGMSKDLRVMLVKLADRLHNVSTIKYLKPEKQKRIAYETQEIYANIAGRLGMFSVKTQLADMCMQILEPVEYKRVKAFVDNKQKLQGEVFKEALTRMAMCLDNNHVTYEIQHRLKSIYSTREKLKTSENILDLFAVRIIVSQPLDCYWCLGIIHSNFFNLPNTFKDFISTPKANLYQSLHTGLVYKGLNFEVQIRTKEMDLDANYGVAAHWRYKENIEKTAYIDSMLGQLSEKTITSGDSIQVIKNFSKQKFINVLDLATMNWKVVVEGLPVLDYVYMLDKHKFSYLEDISINNSKANMYQILQAGDNVAVNYSSNKTIKLGWQHFTKDNNIKKFIQEEIQSINSNLESSVEEFLNTLTKECGAYCTRSFILDFIQKHFKINSIKDFLDAMKYIGASYKDLTKLFSNNWKERKQMIIHIKSMSWKWLIANSLFEANNNVIFSEIKITKCCSKIPPLDIVGVLNNNVLEVHKIDCPRYNKKAKLIVLKWSKEKIKHSSRSFRATLLMDGPFTADCSAAIIATITRYKAVISTFIMNKDKASKKFNLDLVLYVKNYSNLEKIVLELQNKGIIYSWKLI